jgi:alkaline phosphatase D
MTASVSASDNVLTRIAIGSCARTDLEQPVWDAVIDWQPQLFITLGDIVYADTEDPAVMRSHYDRMLALPGYRRLLAGCPVVGVWDDHDYGAGDGGATYPMKEMAQEIFLDFIGEPPGSDRRESPGVQDVQTYGPVGRQVQIILLDTRYFRSDWTHSTTRGRRYAPDSDTSLTMLGEAQWQWLEEALRMPADVRVLASGVQVVADEHGFECWGNFPLERDRLFELIGEAGASGLVMLTGDRHFSEVSLLDDTKAGYPMIDFTSSGLTHHATGYAERMPNRHRAKGAFYNGLSFGSVEIDWETGRILLTAHDVNGKVMFQYPVNLDALRVTGGGGP